jgi:ferredoxin-type protein NapH
MRFWQTIRLGRLRFAVQLSMLVFLLYGGALLGHYAADKLSGTLPALSCAYDNQSSDYCVLIPFQHQVHHRVGEGLVRLQQFSVELILPLLFTLLSFLLLFVVLNKAFCGWICPLGTIQELMYRLGRKLGRPLQRLQPGRVEKARPVKWLMLVGLVFTLPLAAGLGVAPHAAGDAFCQVCPSRVLTSLATGDGEQLAVNTQGWADLAFGALRAFLAGFVIIAALAVRQPFCRICPMLALHATFRRLSPTRLVKRQHDRCEKCGICHQACPMDIHEIWRQHGSKAFHEDCTLCGRCAEFCPDDGVIQIKAGPLTLFGSSRDYYRVRVKAEKPDGSRAKRRALKPGGGGA